MASTDLLIQKDIEKRLYVHAVSYANSILPNGKQKNFHYLLVVSLIITLIDSIWLLKNEYLYDLDDSIYKSEIFECIKYPDDFFTKSSLDIQVNLKNY